MNTAQLSLFDRHSAQLNPKIVTFLTLLFVIALFFLPEIAFADPAGDLQTKGTDALKWIKAGVYFILVISVIGSGVLAAFGRMSWITVGQVLIGAIVAGLAASVVDALYGANGG